MAKEEGGDIMVISQKYNVIDTENGLLDRNVFVDEDIYEDGVFVERCEGDESK